MLFSQNALSIQHRDGFGISFNPIDALKMVNATEDLVHVSMSKEWLEARSNHAHINKIAKPYDWTFTPINFRGTLLSEDDTPNLTVGETEEKIDYEHLKIKEKILYSDELILFEDELDDNGCSKLSVKIVSIPLRRPKKKYRSYFVSFFAAESNAEWVLLPTEVLSEG
jgi:type 2A phosphatase activator TIP41